MNSWNKLPEQRKRRVVGFVLLGLLCVCVTACCAVSCAAGVLIGRG